MVPGSPPLAVSSKTTIFTNPERLPSPTYSVRSRLRVMKRSDAADLCNPYDPRARPGSTRTPKDPPRGRPRDVLRWSWISTGQHPDGASSAGHCRVAWRPSRTPRFAPRRPLLGPGQSKPIGIRARSAFAAQEPPSWMRHDESRRIVDREALPRPAWFAHLLSWVRGPGGWRGRRARALSRRDRTHPPDTPLAQAARLLGPPLAFPREGVRDWPHPRCFPSEELPEGLNLARQAETDPDRPEGELLSTGCSHPVEKEPSPFLSRPDPALMSREEQRPGHWRRSAR
jgi:hypothetical protein